MLNKIKNKIMKMPLAFKILGGIFLLILAYCIVNKKNLLFGVNQEDFASFSDVVFTLYRMNGCGHCEAMHGDWEKLTKELDGQVFNGISVKIRDIECTADENRDTCNNAGAEAFPTMMLQKGLDSNATKIEHTGGRDFNSMKQFVMDNLQ